ncbi:MAG: Gfo/Idh/MocA family oxidoreductase [Candidatus Zambryskibacteria bacterium]|nr:Gfo/Idh/MocA family oxidoreductase [Candidatus Zambryskibacteria bacterium]
MTKVALIGLGRWGKVLLGELSKLAGVKYQCDSKTDLGQIFNDPEVETVFIATPTETHFEIAQKALEAGKHVFLEKPGTTRSSDLEKLVKLAEAKKLKLAIGYEFPHHPAAQKLKSLVSDKKIRSIHFDWQKWGTFKDDAVIHLLCHEVSIAKFLGFELKPLSCKKTKIISDSDIVETEFEGISSRINRVSPIKQKTVTVLLDDSGYIWSNHELFSINFETQSLEKIELLEITPISAEIRDFLTSDTPLSNGSFALEIFRTIEKVRS